MLGESKFTVISDTAPSGVAVNTPILNPSDSIDVIIGDSNFDPGTSAGVVHIIDGVLIPRQ